VSGLKGVCHHTLVLQTVLPALLTADSPSEVVLEGETHNPYAPPFDFLARAFLPLVGRMERKHRQLSSGPASTRPEAESSP
jgi:RNA 3'-terminal phosphate cyclase (ATP)